MSSRVGNLRVAVAESGGLNLYMKTDHKRLSWIQDQVARIICTAEDEGSLPEWVVEIPKSETEWEAIGRGDTVREAIDDAMGQLARKTPDLHIVP